MKNHKNLLMVCEGALMVALSYVLNLLPLYKMPWGGSVDLAMLPIILFCIRWGFTPGLAVCFVNGFLQFASEGIGVDWKSIIGDYFIAYFVVAVAGLFKGKYLLATAAGFLARFLVHYVVGATLWAEYMPEKFFGMTMTSPWIYSILYNGAYLLPAFVLVAAAFLILARTPAGKFIKPQR